MDCYPDVRISLQSAKKMFCQACELKRWCKFNVLLSGRLYNSKTLEVDDFMSGDKQVISALYFLVLFLSFSFIRKKESDVFL